MMTMTDDRYAEIENKTFAEALRYRDRLEADYARADRVEEVLLAVQDRDMAAEHAWDRLETDLEREMDDLRYDSESVLGVTWNGYTDSNPEWGDAEWVVTDVDVLIGTGGPACGIKFTDHNSADVWWQDWFTVKEYATLDSDVASRIASDLGLEFP